MYFITTIFPPNHGRFLKGLKVREAVEQVDPMVNEARALLDAFPEICKTLADTAIERALAAGIPEHLARAAIANFGGMEVWAKWEDPSIPHSEAYKQRQAKWLEEARQAGEYDEELETYAKLPDEEKKGEVVYTSFSFKYIGENVYIRFGQSEGFAGLTIGPHLSNNLIYLDDVETMHRAIQIVENARLEDIDLTLPIRL